MTFSENIISLTIILSINICTNASYAQDEKVSQTKKETTDSLISTTRTNTPVFSEITTITENPPIIQATEPANKPLNNLYGTWNNNHISLKSDEKFDKDTTYILTLVNKNDNKFVLPHKGKVISPFGYRSKRVHSGTDIKLALNDEVYSAFDGIVRMAKPYSAYGKLVVIRHKNGLETCYGHLNKIKVKVNQEVKAGDLIGLGGRTGRATTTHLHFETRFLGEPFNSVKLIDYNNYSLKSDTLVIDKNTFTIKAIAKPKAKKVNFYTVRKGDTLSKIARNNRTTVKDLCRINKLNKDDILSLGKRIKLK